MKCGDWKLADNGEEEGRIAEVENRNISGTEGLT